MGTQSLRCGPLRHVIKNEIGGRASVESRIKLNREPLEEMTREYSRHERGLECLSRQFPRRLSPPFWQEALIIFRFHKFSYVLYVGCLERNLVWGKYIRSSIYRWNIFINYFVCFILVPLQIIISIMRNKKYFYIISIFCHSFDSMLVFGILRFRLFIVSSLLQSDRIQIAR